MDTIIRRHKRVVLQFSGGKDSLACLYKCRPHWDRIAVAWCNPGAEFPETHAVIERVKQLPINFFEVRPAIPQPASIEMYGWPVDVVPMRHVETVAGLCGRPVPGGLLMQDYLACCNRLLFQPLVDFVREYGATLIIRGQRLDEPMKSPVRSGMVFDGIEYLMPLENMSEQEVFEYLELKGVAVPAHYEHVKHSLDCWSCTAFLDESLDKMRYLKRFHPDKWAILAPTLREIRAATRADLTNLDAVCDLEG